MPKISVIIPVYNAEKYIIRCVDSLLNQTLADLEVILIDDHGSDKSIEVVKKYIENHERENMFRFAATPVNSGPGAARNVGIKLAKGKYIAFVDSDDWVELNMYFDLYSEACKYDADICYCQALQEGSEIKKTKILNNPVVEQGVFTKENKAFFLTNYIAYLWTFIFRRDFLIENEIIFPLEKSSEDSYFVAASVLCGKYISRVDKPMYHYVVFPESLSKKKNENRYKDKIKAFEHLFYFAKSKEIYSTFQKELDFIFIKKAYLMGIIDYLRNSDNAKKDVLITMQNILQNQIPNYKRNFYFRKSKMIRVLLFLFQKFPTLTIKFSHLYFESIDLKR